MNVTETTVISQEADHLSGFVTECLQKDVIILSGKTPVSLGDNCQKGVLWQACGQRFLLEIPNTARFCVEDGKYITIDLLDSGLMPPMSVKRIFRMTPLSAFFYQRNELALHAAAVVGPKGAVLIAGDSGTGKSTLLAYMLQNGWEILSDDLAHCNPLGYVSPIEQQYKLYSDSAEYLDLPHAYKPYGYYLAGNHAALPVPVCAVYHLSVTNKECLEINELHGIDKFRVISRDTYNSHIAEALVDKYSYMQAITQLANSVPIYQIGRPRDRWSVHEMGELVCEEWR